MKRKKGNITIGKTLLICSMLLFITTSEFSSISSCQGVLIEEGLVPLEEKEFCHQIVAQDEFVYLFVMNYTYNEEDHLYQKDYSYLDIVNVSQLNNTQRMGRYYLTKGETLHEIVIQENTAFLLSSIFRGENYRYNTTVTLLNVINPSLPSLISEYREDNTSSVYDLACYQNYVYISSHSVLKIIDFTNISEPTLVTESPLPAGTWENYVEISEGNLYLCNNRTLQVYNLTNPKQPILVGEYPNLETDPLGMEVIGKQVYITYRASGFLMVDFSDAANPSLKAEYHFPKRHIDPGGTIEDFVIAGETIFTCAQYLFTLSIKHSQFIRLKSFTHIQGWGEKLCANEEAIFVSTGDKVIIFTYQYQPTKLIIGLSVSGGIILVTTLSIIVILQYKKQKKKKGE
ncbi:MAG TPA: hypothetical protein VMX55_10730 [candidate division Zixibacteria bacterium]|nr:hypothetical protein [candidate division Zixibacteria bacterium]